MVSGIWKWYMRIFDPRRAGFDYFRVGLVRFRSTRVSAGERRAAWSAKGEAKGNTAVDAALPPLGDQRAFSLVLYDTVQGVGSGEAV